MSERDVSPGGLPFPVKPSTIITIIVVILLIAAAMSAFYMVDATEEAVVLRFGRFHTLRGPGLQFKLPFGIDRNYNVPTTVVQYEHFGYRIDTPGVPAAHARAKYPEESLMLTGDLNIVDVEWSIQFLINDPFAWLFHVDNPRQTMRDISQSIINQLVGDRTIFDVMGSERTPIMVQAQEDMNRIFNQYGIGVNVIAVQLRNIVPPVGRVQDAFEDVNKAEQDMERLINEGKEEYNRVIPRIRGEAERIVQVAEGYRTERINEAEGDATRFRRVYDEYRRAPEITRARLYIEMIEDVFSKGERTDLIDKNLQNFLPLKNLESSGGRE